MKQFISAAASVNVGKVRRNNEDNLYFNGIFLTEETREQPSEFESVCGDKIQLYAVCDGMGGEQLGEMASLIAVQTIKKYSDPLKDTPAKNIDAELNRCIYEANDLIFEAQRTHGAKRIGTTLALLAVYKKSVLLYNIGDSRIYLMRGGVLKQLSEDHTSVANSVRAGIFTPEQARTHPHRNRLTQYVGIDPEEMIIEAHKSSLKMRDGDIFLLCSDGLTDMLDDAEIASVLNGSGSPSAAARRLVDEALSRKGKDNITAIVLTHSREKRGMINR